MHPEPSKVDGFLVDVDGGVGPRDGPDAHLLAISVDQLAARCEERRLEDHGMIQSM